MFKRIFSFISVNEKDGRSYEDLDAPELVKNGSGMRRDFSAIAHYEQLMREEEVEY